MLDHSCQVQRHPLSERGDDLYETPPVAVEALLRVETLPRRLWEPACGPGNIVKVLRAAGHEVIGSDLVDYGDPTHFYRRDFLLERKAPDGCQCVITNPPFKLVEPFVAHALDLSPLVIMLLRLAFMESERRTGILEGRGLARIHQFRKRLPMMHRAGWEGRKANSGMAFAWFVWDRSHVGPTTIDRISWERPMTRRPEQQIQRAVIEHLTRRARPGAFSFHVPNGGWRSPIEAKILKAIGTVAGVPDIVCIFEGRCYALELKSEGGRVTDVQRVVHERLREAGAEVAVAHGIDAAIAQLVEWRLLR